MPVSTDTDLLIKAFKIEDKGSPIGVWLYYDTTKEILRTTRVNANIAYLGDFLRPPMTPSEIFVRQTYSALGFSTDFNLGASTTVTSQERGLLPVSISANNIFVSYKPPKLTDVFTFTLYSSDDSTNKIVVLPITISPVDVVPTVIQGNPTINTLNNKYTGLTMLFSEGGVDAGVLTTSSSESSVSNVSFSNGTCTFDYTTPITHTSDNLIFTNFRAADIQFVNTSPHFFEITNLLEQPNFSNWIYTPASQNFSYTNTDSLIAVFNKDIKTCASITASSGTPTSIVPISIIGKQVKFAWTSLSTGSVNFTFNGLTSVDGSIDASVDGLTVAGPILLNTPPTIVGWNGTQPTEENTLYNLSVTFNKQLSNSRTPVITATDGISPVFTSVSGSQVNFTVTTSATPSSTIYTLSNVAASDGSIKTTATISAGAKINSIQVETDLAGSFLAMSNLVIARTQKVKIILSKPIAGTLSLIPNENCAFGVVTMIDSSTAQFTITPVDNGTTFLTIQTNNIITEDGSQSTLSYTFNLVYNQTIVNLFESSNKNVVKTTFDVETTVALSLQVSKPIPTDLTGTTITCSNGTVTSLSSSTILGKYYYNFNFIPTVEITNQTIYVNQAKDSSNFKYTLSKGGLTFINPYTFATAFNFLATNNGYIGGAYLSQGVSSSLTLTFTGGDKLFSNTVANQVSYVKYVQDNVETLISPSILSCSNTLNTITINSITPSSSTDLIVKVQLKSPNSFVSPEITSTITSDKFAPPITAVNVTSPYIPSPYKLVVNSVVYLNFNFNTTSSFSSGIVSSFSATVNGNALPLTSATASGVSLIVPYTASSAIQHTFVFSAFNQQFTFIVQSGEVYTYPTINNTTRNIPIVSIGQSLTLTSNFLSTLPASMTASVIVTPVGYSPVTYQATISGSNISIDHTVSYDVVHSGSIQLVYGSTSKPYTWASDTLTASNIYTFPSTFTIDGSSNGYADDAKLKAGISGALKLTFSGGDMLHSSVVYTQVSYVKYVQSSVETVIAQNLLSCSDPLETVTISTITPADSTDLTIKVKLIGPDGVIGTEITSTVFAAQFGGVAEPLSFRTPGGLQNTTNIGTLLVNGTQWQNGSSSDYQGVIVKKAFVGDFTIVIKFGTEYSAHAMLCSPYASTLDFVLNNTNYYSPSGCLQNFQPSGSYSYSIPLHFYNSSTFYPQNNFTSSSTTHYKYTRLGNYISLSYCNSGATGPWTLISSATIQTSDRVICLIGQRTASGAGHLIATIISEAVYDIPNIDIDPNKTLSYSGTGSIMNNLGLIGGTASLNGTYSLVTILGKKAIHFINTNTNHFNNISAILLPLTNVRTISFWYYLSYISNGYILDGRKTTSETYINGYYSQFGTAWTSANIYVNGGASQSLGGIQSFFNTVSSSWQHITIVANNVIPSTEISLFSAWYQGYINQGNDINMGRVTVYDRVVSQSENNANYLAGL